MATIRCPKCGKENPDSLAVCQYCQTPLKSENTMRLGEQPTKKNTGELEPILPDWLRDVRQQSRDLAKEDADEAATLPKIQKVEPPDLLAGLASQSANADEDDVPDWLASLSPKPAAKPAAPTPPTEPKSDFFSQFENKNVFGSKSEPSTPEPPPAPSPQPPQDELSDWFAKASDEPAEPFAVESGDQSLDTGWDFKQETSYPPAQRPGSAPQEEEDLSWLRNLEQEAKKTGELSAPKQGDEWSAGFDRPPQPGSADQDDLSWLNNLGSLPASEQPKQEPGQPQEDLSWLNAFSAPSQPPATPPAAQDDLSWLNGLGGLPTQEEPSAPASSPQEEPSWLNTFAKSSAPTPGEPASSTQDDLSWLDELGKDANSSQPSAPAQPTSDEDLSWLRDLDSKAGSSFGQVPPQDAELPPVSKYSPRRTAPLDDNASPPIPDWLKSATEGPSLPLGPDALDKIREEKKTPPASDDAFMKTLFGAAMMQGDDRAAPPKEEPAPSEPGIPAPASDSSPLFSQDVSSLFSDNLPDWLTSTEPAESQTEEEIGINAEGGEALSPADLPSWVQAMRPVEAVISDAAPGMEDLPMEREGPLAGLKGVLPAMAFGVLRRPQPIPLKLQATEEQQASAAMLEQILVGETTPRPLVSTPVVVSQQRLRWLIAGLLLFVLAAVLFTDTQIMPVSPVLSPAASAMNNAVLNVANNAPVLVILDYEPALAGEMEAVSGPVLDQLVRLHDPYLSFIATSPSGNALVERLLRDAKISQPDGTPYVAGQNYTNMGYLPGGSSGVQAFLQDPQKTMPASPVLDSSEYAAILLLTDRPESGRVWVEQLEAMKQSDPSLAGQPLLAASSAQAGPMLQPYYFSGQIAGMVSGLPNAARYEVLNGNRPGMARSYWDAFGVGMMMAVLLIVVGSLWGVYTGIRARRAETTEG